MFKIKSLITGLILSAAFLAFTTEEASATKIVVTVYGDEGVSTDNVCGGDDTRCASVEVDTEDGVIQSGDEAFIEELETGDIFGGIVGEVEDNEIKEWEEIWEID